MEEDRIEAVPGMGDSYMRIAMDEAVNVADSAMRYADAIVGDVERLPDGRYVLDGTMLASILIEGVTTGAEAVCTLAADSCPELKEWMDHIRAVVLDGMDCVRREI